MLQKIPPVTVQSFFFIAFIGLFGSRITMREHMNGSLKDAYEINLLNEAEMRPLVLILQVLLI
jgi:hypothetical protein